ncbi:MAG: hypothetical protein P4L55_00070 [Syntrophobacteraceae bacterium]|nr:hypothetical protein [Syntrophobacteraceae bacterium]
MHLSLQYLLGMLWTPGYFCRALMGALGRRGRLRYDQNRPKIMLITFDYVEEGVIESLKNGLEARLVAEVSVSRQEFTPYSCLDFDRNQFNSSALIDCLDEDFRQCAISQEATKVLAVTARDLFVPMLTFVFGGAHLNGRCAVVSSYRLHNEHYGLPHDLELPSDRLIKECLHELVHTLGLINCHNSNCVMKSSTLVEQIDSKSSLFCDRCLGELKGEAVRCNAVPHATEERSMK